MGDLYVNVGMPLELGCTSPSGAMPDKAERVCRSFVCVPHRIVKAYPSVSQVWRRNWARITPFFNYPPEICRAIYTIYTTNSVELLNFVPTVSDTGG
jgi:transposase-like protein